jgi:general secretion pathway protein F
MKSLAGNIEAGMPLAEAIDGQGGRLPPHLRGLVLAGARTGRLGEVLGEFSGFIGIGSELKRRLWLSLAYPMISLVLAVTLFTFVSIYLIPQFEAIFRDFGIPLPRMTAAILQIAAAIRTTWFVLAVTVAALFAFWLTAPVFLGPGLMRSLAARIPMVGGVWRFASLAEFCHLLALLLDNHLPLDEALRLTGEGVQDRDMHTASERLAQAVESGQSLARAMAARREFPPGLPRLVAWSEREGSLPEVLHMAGEMFETRAGAHATFTGTVIGVLSVLLILWGLFTIVVGLMLPLVTLISRLSG